MGIGGVGGVGRVVGQVGDADAFPDQPVDLELVADAVRVGVDEDGLGGDVLLDQVVLDEGLDFVAGIASDGDRETGLGGAGDRAVGADVGLEAKEGGSGDGDGAGTGGDDADAGSGVSDGGRHRTQVGVDLGCNVVESVGTGRDGNHRHVAVRIRQGDVLGAGQDDIGRVGLGTAEEEAGVAEVVVPLIGVFDQHPDLVGDADQGLLAEEIGARRQGAVEEVDRQGFGIGVGGADQDLVPRGAQGGGGGHAHAEHGVVDVVGDVGQVGDRTGRIGHIDGGGRGGGIGDANDLVSGRGGDIEGVGHFAAEVKPDGEAGVEILGRGHPVHKELHVEV